MYLSFLLNFILFVSGVLSNNLISPCKKTDIACIEKSVNAALPKILSGVPELGVESSDPIFFKRIEGDVSIMKYKFTNNTVFGLKTCNITNLKFDEDMSTLSCNVNCPPLVMNGQYEIKGLLLTMPIDGKGDFEFTSGYFLIKINAELDIVKGDDEKNHFFVKNLQVKPRPLSEVKYILRDSVNENKEYQKQVHEFAKKNWLEIALLLQHPIWSTIINEINSHVNKYLENVAIEDILLE